MNKREFIAKLNKNLYFLNRSERQERINFYSEMIDDLIEDGLSEEEAVAKMDDIEVIVSQIREDCNVKTQANLREKDPATLILIIVGFPIWFSLLAGLFSIVVSVYAVVWAVIISLWAVFGSLIAVGVSSIICFAFVVDSITVYFAIFGASLIALGLSILLFFFTKELTRLTVIIPEKIFIFTKNYISKRRVA